MIFSSDIESDDLIVEALTKKEMSVKELHAEVKKDHPVTLRAVYKALNQLLDAGVVVKTGTRVVLSREWVQKVNLELGEGVQMPQLRENESLAYSFSSFAQQDVFWKHLTLLIRDVDSAYPVFFYVPHEIFIHSKERGKSHKEYMKRFEEDKRYAFMTIGSTTVADKGYKKEMGGEFFQVHLEEHKTFKRNYFFTVIGDYIVTEVVEESLAKKIDSLYGQARNEEEVAQHLPALVATHPKIRTKLARNKKRARKLRKQLAKQFHIPRGMQETYDLF